MIKKFASIAFFIFFINQSFATLPELKTVKAETKINSPGFLVTENDQGPSSIRPILKSLYDLDREPAQEDKVFSEGIPLFFWFAFALFGFFYILIFFALEKNHKCE